MKHLDGSELASFIKVRQLRQARNLRQAEGVMPTLAIVRCDNDNPVIDTYVRLKKRYSDDVEIEVNEYRESPETVQGRLTALANDDLVHGIIVQLPVEPSSQTDELLALIPSAKDVDGLTQNSQFDAATPTAIEWLLTGYNIDIAKKKIAVVGEGKLVGAPLAKRWQQSGRNVTVFEKEDGHNLAAELPNYELIITATGVAGLITSDMLAPQTVIIDAGTSAEDGVVKGDVAPEVRQTRQDITISPEKGGVGPLTVSTLFDNVLLAARRTVQPTE